MNLAWRVLAGLLGLSIGGTFLVAGVFGLRGEYALDTLVAFGGALVGTLSAVATRPSIKWHTAFGSGVAGTCIGLWLYAQFAPTNRTLPWLLGFGASNALIFGAALASLAYAFRTSDRTREGESGPEN